MYTAEMVVTNFHALCPLTPGLSNCSMLWAAPFFLLYRLNAASRPKVATFMGKTNESTSSTKRQPSVRKKECQNEGLCDECIDCYYPKRGTRGDHVIPNCGYRSVQLWWRGSGNLLQIKTLSLPRFTPRDSLCR